MTAPGRGASLLSPPRGQTVYAVRSRRTGAVSIGVDLTPGGACTLDCDYCQVPRTRRSTPEPVDLHRVRDELRAALDELGAIAGDVAFAGSGEPTWPREFPEALGIARALVRDLPRPLPVRVFTSGSTLDREEVATALADLVSTGDGEAWVKLDTWDERTIQRYWSSRDQPGHERRVALLGRRAPVVLQTMLVHRAQDATLEQTAAGLVQVVERLLRAGCRIDRLVLSTLIREPGQARAELRAYGEPEMETVAEALRATGVRVAPLPNEALDA
jgi:wyosine [tRNA(Phe)-imidazoG37] synthetase (radical SAM superfamily)